MEALDHQAKLSLLGELQKKLQNVGLFEITGRYAQDRRIAVTEMQRKQILAISYVHSRRLIYYCPA